MQVWISFIQDFDDWVMASKLDDLSSEPFPIDRVYQNFDI